MEKLCADISDAEEKLADSTIYEADNKALLHKQLKRQGDAKSTLEDVEMEWMDLQEELESMEAALNADS